LSWDEDRFWLAEHARPGLIDATVPLADRLLSLARIPVLRGTMREVVAIIREIRM
jgi:hypothetical protein